MSIAPVGTNVNQIGNPHLWGFEDAHNGESFFPEWFTDRASQLAYAQAFISVRVCEAAAHFLGYRNFVPSDPTMDWSPELLAGEVEPVYLDDSLYEDRPIEIVDISHLEPLPF